MTVRRKQYSPKFRPPAAVGTIRGERTLSHLASLYPVHPVQIGQRRELIEPDHAETSVRRHRELLSRVPKGRRPRPRPRNVST